MRKHLLVATAVLCWGSSSAHAEGNTLVLGAAADKAVTKRYVTRASGSIRSAVKKLDGVTYGKAPKVECATDAACLAGAAGDASRVIGVSMAGKKPNYELTFVLVDVASKKEVTRKTYPLTYKGLKKSPGESITDFVNNAPESAPAEPPAPEPEDDDGTAAGGDETPDDEPEAPEPATTELPKWVVPAAIGGGALLFIIMMIFVIKRARKTVANVQAQGANAFASLGLHPVSQDNANSHWQGTYRGWQVGFKSDGQQMAGFARAQGMAAMQGAVGAMLGGGGMSASKQQKLEDRFDNTTVTYKWAVVLPLESPVNVMISRDPTAGQQIAQGVYASYDPAAHAGVTNPAFLGALSNAEWHTVQVLGKAAVVLWRPNPDEINRKVKGMDGLVQISRAGLDAVTVLCDGLFGARA